MLYRVLITWPCKNLPYTGSSTLCAPSWYWYCVYVPCNVKNADSWQNSVPSVAFPLFLEEPLRALSVYISSVQPDRGPAGGAYLIKSPYVLERLPLLVIHSYHTGNHYSLIHHGWSAWLTGCVVQELSAWVWQSVIGISPNRRGSYKTSL